MKEGVSVRCVERDGGIELLGMTKRRYEQQINNNREKELLENINQPCYILYIYIYIYIYI